MDKQDVWKRYGWAISMATWTVIGSCLILLAVCCEIIGTLFLVAYGVFSVSGFLGFLLGIRSVRPDDKPTHLQQIADWLTKLLLGAGLVELKAISVSTWSFSTSLGLIIKPEFGQYIVISVLVGFGALGLITGYLWSQLHYGNE